MAAGATGYVLATSAFQISDWQADWLALGLGGLVGGLLMLIAGMIGNLAVLRASPVQVLRT